MIMRYKILDNNPRKHEKMKSRSFELLQIIFKNDILKEYSRKLRFCNQYQ